MVFNDGIKLHKRTMEVQKAKSKLQLAFMEELEKYPDLTYIEIMQAVNSIQSSLLKYAL